MLPALFSNGSVATAAPTNRLATLFDRFFNNDAFLGPALTGSTWSALPMAMRQDEQNVYVEFDAPGVTEKDIEVSIQDGDLIVRGERKTERKDGGYDTRTYGRFEQRLTLPCPVNTAEVEATLGNGVLSLTCPKSETAKPRKIAIKGGE